MRIGARVIIGIGLLFAAACDGPTPDQELCSAAKGICLNVDASQECVSAQSIPGACDNGYICCVPKGGYGFDAGVDAKSLDGALDAPLKDGAKDAPLTDGSKTDGGTPADAKTSDASKLDATKG
jgi:hypothetical protein